MKRPGPEPTVYWTLVQHSAYGYKGDKTFLRAVETHSVSTAAQRRRVLAAGGKLWADYTEASDAEHTENYPDPAYQGIVPRAQGEFSRSTLGGLRIYKPTSKSAEKPGPELLAKRFNIG
jgi:hypothetical protein